MQRATVSIPVGTHAAGDTFDVFCNADADGRALAAIDYDRPLTERPRPFWPRGSAVISSPADRQVTSPALYLGWYLFAAMAYDALGNLAADPAVEYAYFVNSGPEPVTRFRQTGVAADGRPTFAFARPAQM